MDQSQVKPQLISISETYFNSIESLFKYREKNIWKYNTTIITQTILTLLTMISISLILFQGDDLKHWFGSKISIFNYSVPIEHLWIRLPLFILAVTPVFLVLYGIKTYLKNQNFKFSLPTKQLKFAYLAKCIKELKLFLINDRSDCITTALKHINAYYHLSDAKIKINGSESIKQFLPDILKEISEKRFWVRFDDSTLKVLNAFEDFENKVLKRIEQKEDIDQVIDWLNNLLIYEYSKINKPKKDNSFSTEELVQISQIAFYDFCDCINIAQKIENPISENSKPKSNILNTIINCLIKVCSVFTHKLAIVTFLSWLVLLSALIFFVINLGMEIFNLKVDSTILISSVSIIVLGTITITSTVYMKRNN